MDSNPVRASSPEAPTGAAFYTCSLASESSSDRCSLSAGLVKGLSCSSNLSYSFRMRALHHTNSSHLKDFGCASCVRTAAHCLKARPVPIPNASNTITSHESLYRPRRHSWHKHCHLHQIDSTDFAVRKRTVLFRCSVLCSCNKR